MRRLMILSMAAGLAACDLAPESGRVGRDPPPAAALLAPDQDADLLEELAAVVAEIDSALEGEASRVLAAEAMTDQLMHAPREVDWLATGYSVESRVRQIQAKADAIVAVMRRGASLSAVEPDLQTLRADVEDLRRQLQLPGGGPAPPTLETLLAQDPMRDTRARVSTPAAAGTPAGTPPTETDPTGATPAAPDAPPAGRPLGTPIPDGLD
jgi:hypothetical protein